MNTRETKWTPGEWYVLGDDAGPGDIPFIEIARGDYGPEFRSIAEVRCTDDDDHDFELTDEDRANAHLIAAAPELYDALQAAIDCGVIPKSSAMDGGANRHSEQVRVADMCRAAIAKARGES